MVRPEMTVREAQLNRTFVQLADTLVTDFDVTELLHTLVSRCVDLFDVDAAGLLLADERGRLRILASSNEQTRMLELFEVQSEEGPCSDAFRLGETVIEEDLELTDRWPGFRNEALSAGFRSAIAMPMSLRDRVIGAVNLFRTRPGVLDQDELSSCRALADVATIALIQEQAIREARDLAEQLQYALNSRVIIEQAKGVLAGSANIDVGAAFTVLRNYARSQNMFLVDVARDVVTGRRPIADITVAKRRGLEPPAGSSPS
jgi:transcriptional regulator with GAF, ATPase, and Fis domain